MHVYRHNTRGGGLKGVSVGLQVSHNHKKEKKGSRFSF